MSDKRPIERTFPIEQVNKIAEKEGHARRYYRPVYTMHKYWARRLGSVFRAILLYSLADDEIKVLDNGQEKLEELPDVDWDNPEALWEYYLEDIDFSGNTILDPFMGGGTSVVESIRTGCDVVAKDLNPVAWFVVKKELESVDINELKSTYKDLYESIGQDILRYYETPCPDCGDIADAMYYFWVKELECLNCGHDVPLFKDHYVTSSRSSKDSFKHVLCPDCWTLCRSEDTKSETECPKCSREFVPKDVGYASGRNYTCPKCGQKSEIIEATSRFGKPSASMYAVEYYCTSCDEKGYKTPDQKDYDLYQKASNELEKEKEKLPIPTQRRYKGSFDRAINHGYETHEQMFNDRQLLLLGRLLDEIKSINDQNIMEFMLTTFSSAVESCNMFCMYNRSANKLEPIFNNSLITPRHTPIEGNLWGTEYGRGNFSSMFDKTVAGKEWSQNPVEKYIDENGDTQDRQLHSPAEGEVVDEFNELSGEGDALIQCGTSEFISIPDQSVDAVITDPPYYDNEMYAEQTDFYYVWLREALKDEYEHFRGELTPKEREAVTDPANDVEVKRTEEHYIETLTNIFEESRRKLKDDGIMVFTFHHKETEAWSSTLQSVLDANFYISSLYPVNSELKAGTRKGRATVDYDTVIVCRKREQDPETVAWRSLEDDIYFRAAEEIERLERAGTLLSAGDIFVVAMGKCLEEFSQNYPNVEKDGEKMSVVEAVDAIQDIVDEQLLDERVQVMSDEMDELSAIYLTYVLGRGDTIPYTTLNKALRQRGVDVDELILEGLLQRDGDDLLVLDPSERADSIEQKADPLAIDQAHYLRYLYDEDRLAQAFGSWSSEEAINALHRLAEIKEDNEYDDIAEYVANHTDEQRGISDYT